MQKSKEDEGEVKNLKISNNRNAEIAAGTTATLGITGWAIYAKSNKEEENNSSYINYSTSRTPSVVTFKKDPITTETKVIDKKVTINENQNEECGVSACNDKSLPLTEEEKKDFKAKKCPYIQGGFVPHRIGCQDLHAGSEILEERENGNVLAEGHFWKRILIFGCFWHEFNQRRNT